MQDFKTYPERRFDTFLIHLFRLFVQRLLPASWFRGPLPEKSQRRAVDGHVKLEIVSHCWNYSHMLAYQLSSLINYPPKKLSVTMTVFYTAEDHKTAAVIDYFKSQQVEGVHWNFINLSRGKLLRRGIGRNIAAKNTQADWIWFTDCDIIFHQNCLDSLADKLQHSQETLYYPAYEFTTEMLAEDDPMLKQDSRPQIVDIDTSHFQQHYRDKAKGAFQIVHGDVARAIGYCERIRLYQSETYHWKKTYDDTAFKWLIGSEGIPIQIDGVFQIRHVKKGRYTEDSSISKVRSKIRRLQE